MGVRFTTDEEILTRLKEPQSLGYIGVALGTSLGRIRDIRDQHKAEILKTRIEEHKQSIEGIALQLDLIDRYESLKDWYTKHYGDKT